MLVVNCKFESLGSKESFNSSVRHVKSTVSLSERVGSGENFADALNAMLDEKTVNVEQIQPFVSMLLVDKYAYSTVSKNLASINADLNAVCETVKSWNAVDLVVVYHHPDLGVVALNPKNPGHMSRLDRLNKYELITVYVGGFSKTINSSLAINAASSLIALYEGAKPKADSALLKGSFSYKAPKAGGSAEPAPARKKKAGRPAAAKPAKGSGARGKPAQAPAAPVKAPTGPKPGARMTPMYAVPVTNELFHNGNVEAWKRIIESYRMKHPDLEVLVYYDGEKITNLNALFKWGKVKHGSVIQFAVAGENICDVAKLQRYLAQGASKMFEAFLRGPVNSVLPLF